MTDKILTQSEYYEIYKGTVQSTAEEFTDFSVGSLHDIIGGAVSTVANEVSELIVTEFLKTFFDLAEGSDLQRLAVDHFGQSFKIPDPSYATGLCTFTRPNASAGDVTIEAGTIVKTKKNSSGVEVRFKTQSQVVMTGLSINASIIAVEAGRSGNVDSYNIEVIETALTDDSIEVINSDDLSGGVDTFTDAEYREFIREKIMALAGATEAAVSGAAKAVTGVSMARLTTEKRTVIDYDMDLGQVVPNAVPFVIPYPVLYISDENGNSSQQLIQLVVDAIKNVKAAGVKVVVKGAVPIEINWTASLTLNASGPNYSEFQSDLSRIKETMEIYINQKLNISQGFNKALANAYILSVWGPSGTGDITNFSTSVPSGNVSITSGQKLVSGTMEII